MTASRERHLESPAATGWLGAEIALWLKPGDVVTLEGPIGAGKTALAGAIIAALGLPGERPGEVPSPTFTLVQAYPELRLPVAHVDLYRVEDRAEIEELGIEEALVDGVAVIEWPERMGALAPPDRLAIALAETPTGGRLATLVGHGSWGPRLERGDDLARFIDAAGWAAAERRWLKGDASTRVYERLGTPRGTAVVMNAPPGPDGPPVRDGKPYSQIAHLAESVDAYVALDAHLRGLSLSAPEILDCDLDRGFILLEDLGDALYGALVAQGAGLDAPYEAAIEALARLQAEPPPAELPVAPGRSHRVPRYDEAAYLIEAELLIDWTWPATIGGACPDAEREAYRGLWRDLLADIAEPQVLTLRDFHSPNLLWLPDREGAARAGLIDFQDALAGHPAYDLVSLAEDARIDLPPGMEEALVSRYLARRPAGPAGSLAEADFRAAYAILGAQRAAKVIGIFTRLARRDGKAAYLAHIPRVTRHLEANLRHPRLAGLARWFESHQDLLRKAPQIAAGVTWGSGT